MAGAPGAAEQLNGGEQAERAGVDDHAVVQWGFRLLLGRQPWIGRCSVASTTEEAVELARRGKPDVALVDLFLGERSGAELCEALREVSPKTRVLLISGAGWISPEAAQGRRRLGLHLQGLERRRGGERRAHGGPGDDGLRAPGRGPGDAAVRAASARCSS